MKNKLLFLSCLLIASILFVSQAEAVRLTMKRVIFEGSKRAEVITIINKDSTPKTYRLGWRHYRMTEDKSLVLVPEDQLTPDIKPVVDMVRFAPRRFTIQPSSSQQIRMMMRAPSDLPDGEYRSHLWIRPEANIEDLKAQKKASGSKKSGVSMQMLAGITTPIIIRKGNLEATASITNLSIRDAGEKINASFSLNREGNRSIYGDFKFTCNAGSGAYELQSSRGIAVYAEVNRRNFNLNINKAVGKPRCSTLKVSFFETKQYEGDEGSVIAEAAAQVN